MVAPTWTHAKDVTVEAKLSHGYWTLALDYVDHAARLLLQVEANRVDAANQPVPNTWKYGDKVCTADGDDAIPLQRSNSLLEDAPPGALVAKVGGSRAGKKDGVASFVVGSYCVHELIDKQRGPLYLAMNIEPGFLLEPSGSIVVRIWVSG